MVSTGQALSHERAMCWSSPETNRVKDKAEQGERTNGKGRNNARDPRRNARKEAGDVTVIMRESEGEEAVHTYSVTAHVLYKGMENL